jgi:hypothetical protein
MRGCQRVAGGLGVKPPFQTKAHRSSRILSGSMTGAQNRLQSRMPEGRLSALSQQLAEAGIDPGGLRDLQVELDAIQHPPGVLTRATGALRKRAQTQWRHLVGELKESAEAMRLVGKGLARRPLSPEERDTVRAQMLDLVRVVPAGVIAMANSALPVPGTSVFTPWILDRLGLMPSRWREAHLLDQMRQEATRLEDAGYSQAADALLNLQHQIEDEADERERTEQQAALLTHWDANGNGAWDEDEVTAYQEALVVMKQHRVRFAARRAWYLSMEGHVFGPVRLSRLPDDIGSHGLLACYNGQSGWVGLDDLLED